MKKIAAIAALAAFGCMPIYGQQQQNLSFWFDTPVSLQGRAIWYGGKPDQWKGENKPESAGDTARNPDQDWETQSIPVGNGSLGANILGPVEAERITFNEKTLWRGGPNTAKGIKYEFSNPRVTCLASSSVTHSWNRLEKEVRYIIIPVFLSFTVICPFPSTGSLPSEWRLPAHSG